MSSTYSDVDSSGDPAAAARWQDQVDSWPQVQVYKQHIRERLDGAEPILDVGCGPGGDLATIAPDHGVGLDPSAAMCRAALARGVTVCRADGHRLPFASDSFGGAVADRVLQHVADPALVLREMDRVVRPGGLVVVADPDQETLVMHVPGVRQDLVDRVKALRRDIGYRNGRLASSLLATFADHGLAHVSIGAFPLALTDPDDAFGVPGWPELWREEGEFTDQDVADWHNGIDRGRRGGFLYAVTYFVASGTKPERSPNRR